MEILLDFLSVVKVFVKPFFIISDNGLSRVPETPPKRSGSERGGWQKPQASPLPLSPPFPGCTSGGARTVAPQTAAEPERQRPVGRHRDRDRDPGGGSRALGCCLPAHPVGPGVRKHTSAPAYPRPGSPQRSAPRT